MSEYIKQLEEIYGKDFGAKSIEELTEFLKEKGYKDLAEIIGG